MTALATTREADRQDGVLIPHPVLAAEKIYKGSTVLLKATAKSAFSNDGVTNTLALDYFAGIAASTADNSSGLVGAVSVDVFKTGCFLLPFAAGDTISAASVGLPVYVNNVTDDGEVTITPDATLSEYNLKIGYITELGTTADTAWVQIDRQIGAVAVQNPAA